MRNEIGFLAEELTKIQLESDDVCRQVFLIPGDYHLSVDQGACIRICKRAHRRSSANDFSYFVGAAIGRWDVRLVAESEFDNPLPDPFGRLPLVPPGMLKGTDEPASDIQLNGYPIQIDWDSILVDDRDHKDDIVEKVHQDLQAVWKERADAVEKEICEALGVGELRKYFLSRERAASGNTIFLSILKVAEKRRSTGYFSPQRRTMPSGCTTTDWTETCSSRHW